MTLETLLNRLCLGNACKRGGYGSQIGTTMGDVDTIDVGSGYFLVNCKRDSTYDMVLAGGP